MKLVLQFWFTKVPMFALPRGWFPWQVEWLLSFPRAPLGTVSIQAWGAACGTVVSIIGDAIGQVAVYVKNPQKTQKKMSEPVTAGKGPGAKKTAPTWDKKTE